MFKFLGLILFSISAIAYVPNDQARLISDEVVNGQRVKIYTQESFSDEYTYCYQKITLVYQLPEETLISSESVENCNRIR